MGWIIGVFLVLVIIGLIAESVKKFKTSAAARKKYFIVVFLVLFFHSLYYDFSWLLAGILLLPNILAGIKTFRNNFGNELIKNQLKEWRNQTAPQFSLTDINNMLDGVSKIFYKRDINAQKYTEENIPYGRANTFLNYFEKNIELEDMLYYSPKTSLEVVELREYGLAFTNAGIYLANQYLVNTKNKEYGVDQFDIRFKGLFKVQLHENHLTMLYEDFSGIRISREESTIPLELIHSVCSQLIENKYTLALLQSKIVDDTVSEGINYQKALNEVEKELLDKTKIDVQNQILTNAGTVGAMDGIVDQFGELKNLMNGRQGHGYAAEYGNNTIDKLKLKSVQNAGAQLENGRQIKNGADRIVNGVKIQTKYCKTAERSVAAMLDQGSLHYIDDDGSLMKVEVPRDQYPKAVKDLQRRIDNGEIKNLPKGTRAEKILAKGALTLRQSILLTKSGSVESLAIDTISGAIICAYAGGVSALFTFVTSVWSGRSLEESLQASFQIAVKVIGRGTAIYVFSMQLSRPEFINYFSKGIFRNAYNGTGYTTIMNPIYQASEKMAGQISSSALAKSTLGNKLDLQKLKGKTVIGSGVLLTFTFGPDIARAMVGRISPQQLFKNAATSTAAMAGAVIGNTFMPVVGAVVGGAVGGFIAKSVLDEFIEDDAKEMYQILKEEFIDCVMLLNFNKIEFDEIITLTLGNPELPHVLRDMFASGDTRSYARENLVEEAAIIVLGKRKRITQEMIDEAIKKYIDVDYTVSEALA